MKRAKAQPTNGNGNGSKIPGPRSVYLGDLYITIQKEATRLDRSASWVLRECVRLALPQIKKLTTAVSERKQAEATA